MRRVASTPIAAMSNPDKKLYAVQFHPEVHHSEHGNDVLNNFVFDVCGATGDWTMESFIETEIAAIQAKSWRT